MVCNSITDRIVEANGPWGAYLHPTMQTRTDLLSYYQEVLDKISHADRLTFRKELRKAFKRLMPAQREELKAWFRSACVCRVDHRTVEAPKPSQA